MYASTVNARNLGGSKFGHKVAKAKYWLLEVMENEQKIGNLFQSTYAFASVVFAINGKTM